LVGHAETRTNRADAKTRRHDSCAKGDMTDQRRPPQLPHHRLVAYQVAVDLLLAIKRAQIRDAKLRDEALRAAKSAVLNIAEGAGRVSRADKARAFTIARGEGIEAFAALETAALLGDADHSHVQACLPVAQRLYALLTGLVR
jgi:four helix bundle protein